MLFKCEAEMWKIFKAQIHKDFRWFFPSFIHQKRACVNRVLIANGVVYHYKFAWNPAWKMTDFSLLKKQSDQDSH